MIHILLIAEDPLASTHAAALLTSSDFKVVRKDDLGSARSLLATGLFDLLIVTGSEASDVIPLIPASRSAAPDLGLVALAPGWDAATEARAYAAGADLVLSAPLTAAVFTAATRRLLPESPARTAVPPTAPAPVAALPLAASALEVLRDFSQVLGYSLDYKLFTQHFVLKLREILSVNRIAIFLEHTAPPTVQPAGTPADEAARLTCAAAVGIPRDLLECIELTRSSGIGHHVTKRGQILRLDALGGSAAELPDPKILREFEILGCQVALPVNDRERTLGVALIGGRVTGGSFSDAELQLVYHLLEELGLAVKNSWLHDQLSSSHRLFGDVLSAINSGCLVVGADLRVLHTNRAFLQFLRGDTRSGQDIDFSELPPPLAAALHDLVEKGRLTEPFFLSSERHPDRTYRVSLLPLPGAGRRLAQPAMATVEDFTAIKAAQRAEIEASNLRLMTLIAKRFAHEIRNSLVPLTTHHQLLDSDYESPDFRASLKTALGRETSRIQRFTEQMLFLSQPPGAADEVLPAALLLQECFERACRALAVEGRLELSGDVEGSFVRAHRPSLAHAFEEIFLNGLQSAPAALLRVRLQAERATPGAGRLRLQFRDQGPGLAPAVAARATEPFFTTRSTGVGLGLTIARRIIEQHAGQLEVLPRITNDDPDVILQLPLA